jgi:hypothetical protein
MAMAIVKQGLNDADKERPFLADADARPRTNT